MGFNSDSGITPNIVKLFFASLCLLILISCGSGSPSVEDTSAPDSISLVIEEWKNWAESSDDGLWEGDSSHSLTISLLKSYGGPDDIDPPFYYPEGLAVAGDTVFITDNNTQKLVAIDESGEVLWETEGLGEGPGHFTAISQVNVNDHFIAVTDLGNARVDFFNRAGEWLQSVPALSAYDVHFLDDSLAVVAKYTTSECFLVVSVTGDTLSTFGSWADHLEGWPSNRDLHIDLKDSLLIVTSYYSDRIEIYDLQKDSMTAAFARDLPFEFSGPENDGGMISLTPVILDVYTGPEGMINVLYRPFNEDKCVEFAIENLADISVIDRYNYDGEYLDSYIIPKNVTQATYDNGKLYAINDIESMLDIYSIECNN
ncbi:hypothetical protein CSA37_06845 [Candidatus Fermentibacteria bacterium]|nr:MAG: hypothetical protein CSA37_06845 [Candidatus Fermentibacteria bacterium]